MKILLDECLPGRLKNHLKEYDVFTVAEIGWTSMKNGNLLRTAIENNFDVFLTVDKKLEYEQNIKSLNITIVVFDVHRNKIEELIPLIKLFNAMITELEKGKVYTI
jgi:predicted nuclease of predicted toxin-antitoxin system